MRRWDYFARTVKIITSNFFSQVFSLSHLFFLRFGSLEGIQRANGSFERTGNVTEITANIT